MSATKNQDVTHDVGMRISWNNRPVVSVRPDKADAKMGLPGGNIPWQVRRQNMKNVCTSCHNKNWVNGFYTQYDALIDLYNNKFAIPGRTLYELAKPLRRRQAAFSHRIDWTWFELWHHEGRRARHGASMMAPDYTHWHGTYELARNFYTRYIPELEDLAERAQRDPAKQAGAKLLLQKIDEVLNSDDHKWFLDKMDPKEAAEREAARKKFLERYKK